MYKTTEHIRSLDLCRGFAAILILFYHVSFLFSDSHTLFQSAYLCVDFFFLLSGFVIANSYETKLQEGLGVLKFTALRVARLWPLVVLATLIGLMVQLPRWYRELGSIDPLSVSITTLSNALSLPTPVSPNEFLFPLNGAAWSIFFEIVINIAYALILPMLRYSSLVALIVVSGIGLAVTAHTHNTLDVGWSVSNFVYGFPRVAFSFFVGVCINRMARAAGPQRMFAPPLLLAGLVCVVAALSVPATALPNSKGIYDFLVAAIVFPALLVVALRTRFGSWGNSAAWLLGGISYSVYLLQTPLMIGYSGIPQVLFGAKIGQFAPWGGVLFVALLLPVAYLTWIYFEQPMQRWLRSLLLGRGPARMQPLKAIEK